MELIRRLGAGGIFQRLFGSANLETFKEIATKGEPAAVAYLAGYLLDSRDEVRLGAAEAISKLFRNAPPHRFTSLDENCRGIWWRGDFMGEREWRALQASDLRGWLEFPDSAAALGLASFHANGHVREAAVRLLATLKSGEEFPFLLTRCNDWVEQVRVAAAESALSRCVVGYEQRLVRNIGLIARLGNCGRLRDEVLLRAFDVALRRREAEPFVLDALRSDDKISAREAARLIRVGSLVGESLLAAALESADPVVRLRAVREGFANVPEGALRRFLLAAGKDKAFVVRAAALTIWAQRMPRDAEGVLIEALTDRSRAVRNTALGWMSKLRPDFDPREFYKRKIAENRDLASAFLGLAETCQADDGEIIRSYFGDQRVGVRKAVVRALSKLGGREDANVFLNALIDSSPGVSREAARALRPNASDAFESLQKIFRSVAWPHARRNAFDLLLRQGYWERGIVVFQALRDRDEMIVARAQTAARKWVNGYSSTKPTVRQAKELQSAVKASAAALTAKEIKEIEFLLRTAT